MLAYLLCIAVAAAPVPAIQPLGGSRLDRYVAECARTRVLAIDKTKSVIASTKALLEQYRRARVGDPKNKQTEGMSTDGKGAITFVGPVAKRTQIARTTVEIKELESKLQRLNDPKVPFVPELWCDDIEVGRFGTWLVQVKVRQIIDDRTLRIESCGRDFWVEGVNTAGHVDDEQCTLSGVFEVSGTKQYTTVGGGSRTIFVLSHFDPDKPMP